jgi:oxygen-independent coproporphyrinogen-3 oxidase
MPLLNWWRRSLAEFGVYIHWPFCLSKCPYCDFNSHVREAIDETGWRQALLAAIDRNASPLAGRRLDSIFFGGGTPSLMSPGTVGAVIERILRHFPAAADIEITLEANPNSVEAQKFADFAAAGINRVSLGIQALGDDALKSLGRAHNAAEARAAIAIAARHFRRYSFDLIYARPGQDVAAWDAELRAALDLAGDHLSLYQLTIEPGTQFHTAHARGDLVLPEDELAGDLYEHTQALLEAHGLPAYEISNHARRGQESRHNLVYWRYGDYLGIGPGAHGRLTDAVGAKLATRQERLPETWAASIMAGGDGVAEAVEVASGERLVELTMMGLRLAEGIPDERFRRETAKGIAEIFDAATRARLIDGGFLAADQAVLRATPAGRQRLNAVLAALLT